MPQQHDSIVCNDLLIGRRDNAARPSLAFGNGNTGIYESGEGVLRFSTSGINRIYLDATGHLKSSDVSGWALNEATPSNVIPTIIPNRSDFNTGIGHATADALALIAGGSEVIRLTTAGLILKTVDVPANAADTGVAGQIAYDATWLYICVATNSWTRVAIAAW